MSEKSDNEEMEQPYGSYVAKSLSPTPQANSKKKECGLPESFGCRSSYGAMPQYNQGNTSPVAQGRSVREYEEQMSAIRKENFNLRLRLYFLEEEMNSKRTDVKGRPIQGAGDAQENAVKQLINTKVEMEMLRKECQEKQELLRDAAQAMNKIEQRQKENEERSQMMIEELTERIQYLEAERNQKTRNDAKIVGEIIELTDATSDDASAKQKLYLLTQIRDLEANVAESKETIKKLETEILKLNQQSEQKQARLQEYEEKLVTLSFENDALKEKLQQQHEQAANSEREKIDLREEVKGLRRALQKCAKNEGNYITSLKSYEDQLREHNKGLEKVQSAVDQGRQMREYEHDHVNNMKMQYKVDKQESSFFKSIMEKLEKANQTSIHYETETKEQQAEIIAATHSHKQLSNSNNDNPRRSCCGLSCQSKNSTHSVRQKFQDDAVSLCSDNFACDPYYHPELSSPGRDEINKFANAQPSPEKKTPYVQKEDLTCRNCPHCTGKGAACDFDLVVPVRLTFSDEYCNFPLDGIELADGLSRCRVCTGIKTQDSVEENVETHYAASIKSSKWTRIRETTTTTQEQRQSTTTNSVRYERQTTNGKNKEIVSSKMNDTFLGKVGGASSKISHLAMVFCQLYLNMSTYMMQNQA